MSQRQLFYHILTAPNTPTQKDFASNCNSFKHGSYQNTAEETLRLLRHLRGSVVKNQEEVTA